jgi:hypothetical protein
MGNNKKKKKKYNSEYRFFDDTESTRKFCTDGSLIHPRNARKYAIKFFNIVKSLIFNSYEILDCYVLFEDFYEFSFDKMWLVKNGKFSEEGILEWENKYCSDNAQSMDLISRHCLLVMHLRHINGTPSLVVKDNMVINEKGGRHCLKHPTIMELNSEGKWVAITESCWTSP